MAARKANGGGAGKKPRRRWEKTLEKAFGPMYRSSDEVAREFNELKVFFEENKRKLDAGDAHVMLKRLDALRDEFRKSKERETLGFSAFRGK